MVNKKPRRSKAKYADDPDDPSRCHAGRKSDGERCTKPVTPGYWVCRFHGAGGGAPIQSGKYSERLGRFRQAYEESLASGDSLFDLRETAALLELQVKHTAERASEFDSVDFRKTALALYQRVVVASGPDAMRDALMALGKLLTDGEREDEALAELMRAAERLAVRQEKAWAIMMSTRDAMPRSEVNLLMTRFFHIVIEEADGKTSKRILNKLDAELLADSPRCTPISSSGE